MTEGFEGKRFVVTGAGSGIGAVAAKRLAEAGARLILFDYLPPRDSGGLCGASYRLVDVRDETSVATSMADAIDELGGLDGLINCAGVATTAKLEDTSLEQWRALMDTNLTGVFLTCRAAADALRTSGSGVIVNLASASGLIPSFAGAAYSASKAGVVMLSKALARELAPQVRVNAVCPGAVRTPMFAAMTDADPATAKAAGAGYALGRIAEPEEIAAAIVFLAGDASSFITGAALAVDGGRSFH